MRIALCNRFGYAVLVGCLGLAAPACNTTKATTDTTVKFTSSTSPDSLFTQDGLLEPRHKVHFYAVTEFENLQQDVARGHGEYLTSLAVLLEVPPDRRQAWGTYIQSRAPVLLASDRSKAGETVTDLTREFAGNPNMPNTPHTGGRTGGD